ITPWGQFIGAVIMFWVLGFLPTFILAGILKKAGVLRIPEKLELAGLDFADYQDRYLSEEDVNEAEKEEARRHGLIS
ncbi:MAG: ammonium transporter, partial [Rhodobacteraceae bacterium]|nr:ammonium transporter [Paracoccaceae bacterium]